MGGWKLYEKLEPDRILIDPPVRDRSELFARFGRLFQETGHVADAERVVRLLEERERILPTGIGRGVAVPHAQLEELDHLVLAVSTHPGGLDYPALDEEPVRLVFCLLGGLDTASLHLAGLAHIARIARRSGELAPLVEAPGSEAFLERLRRIEGGA